MSLNLDLEVITITCSHCSSPFEETILRLKFEPKLSCPNCGENVLVNLLKLYKALESVQESTESLLKKLARGSSGKSLY